MQNAEAVTPCQSEPVIFNHLLLAAEDARSCSLMSIPGRLTSRPFFNTAMTNNENGNNKVFNLAPVKSADEIAAESVRKIAPEMRRGVAEMSGLTMAAKGFFSALLDYTFMYTYGGNKHGKLFASVKDLGTWLKHDKDSITKWRDELVSARLVWVRNGWPKSEWRICGICPPPASHRHEYQSLMGLASEQQELAGPPEEGGSEQSGKFPCCSKSDISEAKPQKTEEIRECLPKESPNKAETFRRGRGILPLGEGIPSAKPHGNFPQGEGNPSAGPGESFRRARGFLPQGEGIPSARVAEGSPHTKETPKEFRRSGGLEGMGNPPLRPRNFLDAKEQMAAIGKQIKALKADEANYGRILSKEVAEAVAWLRDPANAKSKADLKKNLAEADRREQDPKNRVKGGLLPESKQRLEALIAQKDELEKQLAGV